MTITKNSSCKQCSSCIKNLACEDQLFETVPKDNCKKYHAVPVKRTKESDMITITNIITHRYFDSECRSIWLLNSKVDTPKGEYDGVAWGTKDTYPEIIRLVREKLQSDKNIKEDIAYLKDKKLFHEFYLEYQDYNNRLPCCNNFPRHKIDIDLSWPHNRKSK